MAYGAKYYAMQAARLRRFGRGDPGLLGNIVKGIGKVAKIAAPFLKVIPGVGAAVTVASAVGKGVGLVKAATGAQGKPLTGMTMGTANFNKQSMGGVISGSTSTAPPPAQGTADYRGIPFGRKRYRRMNATNMRALTRAVRRVKRFEKIARSCITLSAHVRVRKGSRGRKC